MAYQTSKDALFGMFVDNTAGETYNQNRLITRENQDGNAILVAYGWLKLAEYNESRDVVTVFSGHKALRSKTVSRWLNEVVSAAKERGRDVVITGESPVEDTPNVGTKFINNYISMSGSLSPVERSARETVVDSLRHVA